jgi:hypothetical protein
MKKFIATTIAAAGLAIGGAASAQDLGNVIGTILNLAIGGDVTQPSTQVYADAYGRHFYYDQYGRQVYIQNINRYGSITGYDAWGRPIYGGATYGNVYPSYGTYGYSYPSTQYSYNTRSWDYDGDGVSNTRDRWPNDPRYR